MRVQAFARPAAGLALLALPCALGCAELRQNMRGQELSYRGAYYCQARGCSPAQMVVSREGRREGEMNVSTVSLQPKAALAFTAASAFERLDATARDCEGHQAEIPSTDIVAAGKHEVGDANARESWIVWLDPASLPSLKSSPGCSWRVEAHATWTDGAEYTLAAGVDIAEGS